jgi:tRNA(Arg) A34 adenosine deaminase TadA
MKRSILNKCIKMAHESYDRKYKMCAIIVDKKNNVLSVGFNSYEKSSPLQKKYSEKFGNSHKIYNHAEINAISKIPYGKTPSAIYVARVNNFGEPRLAKPCSVCRKAIDDLKIENIYFTKGE